ncbi:MAG: hypothetical protein HY360_07560 [Verrucomicrobia bacterium]|nr:hypothetical protein [Verrucomicrobiota bacterium]
MNLPGAAAKQHEFSFVAVLPGPGARAERKRKAAAGDRTIEPPMYFCEVKASLLPREAAADLGCCVTKILEMVQDGRLEAHPLSIQGAARNHVRTCPPSDLSPTLGDGGIRAAHRVHLRISAASVARIINAALTVGSQANGLANGRAVKSFGTNGHDIKPINNGVNR